MHEYNFGSPQNVPFKDVFSGPGIIGKCHGFPVPGASFGLAVLHSGADGWGGESVAVMTSNGDLVRCKTKNGGGENPKINLDHEEFAELKCPSGQQISV